jgi:hypothetical protein
MNENLKAYLLIFDAATFGGVSPDQLNSYIKQNRDIEKWWTYLPSCYALLSNLDRHPLIGMFTEFLKGQNPSFIVTPFDPALCNGFLPKDAWTAFKSDIEIPYKEAKSA